MLSNRFSLYGDDGKIECERFGSIWRVWEYGPDNLQGNMEMQVDDIADFVLYWQDNGYPLLNAI